MSEIVLRDWYQLDFQIQNHTKDLQKIDSVMERLEQDDLVSKWFFLWEGETIRVRMKSNNKEELEKKLTELAERICFPPKSRPKNGKVKVDR